MRRKGVCSSCKVLGAMNGRHGAVGDGGSKEDSKHLGQRPTLTRAALGIVHLQRYLARRPGFRLTRSKEFEEPSRTPVNFRKMSVVHTANWVERRGCNVKPAGCGRSEPVLIEVFPV